MTEEILKENVLKLMSDNSMDVLLFDAFNDELICYSLVDGKFTIEEKKSFAGYLEELKTNIEEQYFKSYMNFISIPKLEEAKKSGKEKVTFTYKTLNNKTYINTSMLINTNSGYAVLVLRQEQKDNFSNDKVEETIRFNSLIDSLSDAIIKIQNVFSLDQKSLSNINNIEYYINSIFEILTSNYPELKKSINKVYANVTSRKEDTILIVDDDMVTRNMIKKLFDENYKIVTANNGKEAIEYLDENASKGVSSSSDHVIGIFLDLTMPVLDGFAVLEYLSKKNYLTRIPVIIISGDYEKETKARVYNYNIADMLEKPFDFEVVKHRIGNFINLYKSSNSLSNLINVQSEELKDLINIFVDAYLYDYKQSIEMVNKYIKVLATKVMQDYPEYNLSSDLVDKMADASIYYDVGFYSIPILILSKANDFTKDEINKIKNYPLFGAKMTDYLLGLTSDSLYKKYCANITKYYHENYDGTGYPEGLLGDTIPLESQIAAVCIMYNNLRRKSHAVTKDTIIDKSGTMFNPKIVGSFMKVADEFEKIS